MKKKNHKFILIPIGVLLLLLAACGSTKEQLNATQTQIALEIFQTLTVEATQSQIALEIFQTQTAEVMQTFTPLPIFTSTPSLTPKPTDTPTSMPGFCSYVDLNGRYVDYRESEDYLYGWVMDVEQTGCEIVAYEFTYLQYEGIETAGDTVQLTGTIVDNKVTVCYTNSNYCVPLVIFGGGQTLANGIEHWQYDKIEE